MLSLHNPATGQVIRDLLVDNADAVAAKAKAARRAQPGWAALPLAQRIGVLMRFRQGLAGERDALAQGLTNESGKPIVRARREIDEALTHLDYFIDHAEAAFSGEPVHSTAGVRELVTREPLGVVAHISAGSDPYLVGGSIFVPALLAGNALLYKPSEHATLSGLNIARLLHQAGVPKEVFAPLVGGPEVGAAVLAQAIEGACFAGQHAAGLLVAQALSGRLVKLHLALGGHNPVYVRADADLDAAAETLATAAMAPTGPGCGAVGRLYVEAPVQAAFLERLLAAVARLPLGNPLDEATRIGPLPRAAHLDTLQGVVAEALSQGAVVRCGGQRIRGPGHWYAPTVVTEVHHGMTLMREETIGPVIGVQTVVSDDEAVALMNDTRYGLAAGIYTGDLDRARALLSQVRAGTVYTNGCGRMSPRLPWSGVGDSGVGVALSVDGLRAFSRPKAWQLHD